ncbi:MAG: ABC transporter permease [Candidatus Woesearchaeota archaeon]|jgi:putative ABC transport system permease protein
MKITKSLQLAFNILVHSKLRSWLTIIGIVIGVAAVVAIVSVGDGMQQSITSRLSGLGADIITVSPGGGRASSGFRGDVGGSSGGGMGGGNIIASSSVQKNLTKIDVMALSSVENIQVVTGTVSGRGEMYYLGQSTNAQVLGVDPVAWNQITTSTMSEGRALGPSDYNAIVIGYNVATKTFKQLILLNSVLTIEGKAFKVVGILKEGGNSGQDDSRILMPIDAARETLDDVGTNSFSSITIKAKSPDYVDQIMIDADNKLAISRHVVSKKDYRLTSAKAMQEQISSITATLTLFLGAIAAISLLVGAVGIANTMFTSVLEKTKEIGIMKAIGAKNKDIMLIFIFNAAMVGMVGGILGILFGSFLSFMIPSLGVRLLGQSAITTVIAPSLLIEALLVSVIIGVVAGAVPAYRASKLKPVDALRYE